MNAIQAMPDPSPGVPPVGGRTVRPAIDPRYIAPLFISVVLVVGELAYGVLESIPHTLAAILASIATEAVLGLLVYRRVPHLASAYVSGISVGILVRSGLVWPFLLCSVLSIASKYLFRVHNRHIWNPSNFGISVMIFLAPMAMSTLGIQWGNSLWAMAVVWTLGSVIVWRLRRFHICAVYVVSFVFFALMRCLFNGQPFDSEIAPITGPMYQLFIFFMITDPKSTVRSKNGQMVVAFCVAAMESFMRTHQNIHAPYYALFTVGPIANLIDIYWERRRTATETAVAPASAAEV